MGVHNQIRTPSIPFWEGHVFLRDDQSHYSFLSMARTEFISNLWNSSLPCYNFDKKRVIRSWCYNNTINVRRIRPFVWFSSWFILNVGQIYLVLMSLTLVRLWHGVICHDWGILINVHISIRKCLTDTCDSSFIQCMEFLVHIQFMFFFRNRSWLYHISDSIRIFLDLSLVSSHVKGCPKPSI